ncbi:hypothetical protein [Pectinatus frisingensis]|nr:hypothetical protein [Pectinatus frisingensis]
MVNRDKSERINILLARLPLFTPYGWKCLGIIGLTIIVTGVIVS